ncbi:MAG TPA: chemotaxis protein CheW [Nitrospirales bacterium]|jgi:chemotaxis signal transduction protein|nr:chemotaxis protein CheW [Nitrospirales bacterium]
MRTGRIDWGEVRRKLTGAEQALSAALVGDERRTEALLRKRADYLAARRSAVPTTTETQAVMVFCLGRERYAVGLPHLRQVVPLSGLTPLSDASEGMLGVMNFRGEVGTVWDLARLLELPQGEISAPGHVLVMRADRDVGLRVDYVEGRIEIDAAGLILPHTTEATLPTRFLKGLTQDKIHVLDVEALLGSIFSETGWSRMTQGTE